MVTLLTYPKGFGQFSLSPFCVKAAYLLSFSGQEWARQDLNDPRKMPQAKLPVLRTQDALIADSHNIRTWLERQGAEFDRELSDLQKAQSHALVRMAEEHLYFHLVLDRWGDDTVWPVIREKYFGEIPAFLRRPVTNRLRRTLLRGLNVHGISRFTPERRLARCERDLQAIQAHLWHSPFLMGKTPTAADFSVGPVLAGLRSTPVDTALSSRIAHDAQLTDYLDRLEDTIPLP